MEETVSCKVVSHSFDKIIGNLEREDMAQRDRGTLFELLVTAYLKKEPMYARLFDEVGRKLKEKVNVNILISGREFTV